ncbi:DUF4132 domain-containing protein [Kitasatospora sp. NBC_01287]|uniref:DUF4132 domain-containing protein n=1 Tax=Kitasatospora sp. NBC_01287 TaxID=2903573 RepID=UPI00225218C3|nr:DUF4132 domain-containing protein [Kitasatospora sp. NBC_01287]MCX4744447.1 DUF4132 domain-containing protein [Kitasatospora sp. NBC_01287]
MRRWEYVEGSSAKFWEAAAEGGTLTVRYGRVGTAGREQSKELDSAQSALDQLAKLIAEKERKGYREVEAAAEAATATEAPAQPQQHAAAVTATVTATVTVTAERPDETTFTLPPAWQRALHPRRGGIARPAGPLAERAGVKLEKLLRSQADWIERMLTAEKSDQELVAAARAQQLGSASPLGTAVLAVLAYTAQTDYAVLADAWVAAHGLPFAARTVVECFEVEPRWHQQGGQTSDHHVTWRAANSHHRVALPAADRVRALLAEADEETYRAAVAALATARDGGRRRIVAAYLVPTETAWVDECCADLAPAAGHQAAHLRSMLVRSLSSPEQAAGLTELSDLGWHGWSTDVIGTVAEGIGTALAPLIGAHLEEVWIDAGTVRTVAATLREVPSDEAFELLLGAVAEKHVRAELMAAMNRYPVRALRLLPKAADDRTDQGSLLKRLLITHVTAHQELALAVLPELPAELAEVIRPLAEQADRLPAAPAEALPALLTSPPWTVKRRAGKPQLVTGLTASDTGSVHWLPGESDEWRATTSWFSDWSPQQADWEHLLSRQRAGLLGSYEAVGLFTHGPIELVAPLLPDWPGPPNLWEGGNGLKPLIARHGVTALPVALRVVGSLGSALPLLLPFRSVEVARLMADRLARLKSAAATARSWFTRHGSAAAELLVPDAVGAVGPERRNAEGALRLIAAVHGAEAVRAAATPYGAEAAGALDALLTDDPLAAALPARLPAIGAWADARLLPQLVLRGDTADAPATAPTFTATTLTATTLTATTAHRHALPADAAQHLITMLALSKPGAEYPGVAMVAELCTPASAAEFGWALFELWRLAGMPPKDSWALHALALLGDDDTVRRLTPVLRAWPGEGAHQRAVDGLEVLAAIGSDVALLHLHGIAQRVKFKALKVRAQEKIAEVAAGLGLSGEQLADRLVPDFGLDPDGTTVIDYGPRHFTVGFDEQLRPYVLDQDGRRRKDLPAPAARDDAELAPAERKRFAALKKDVRTVAGDQVHRLEQAMVAGRSWTAAEFRELFVQHPLLWHLVRRLLWLAETQVGTEPETGTDGRATEPDRRATGTDLRATEADGRVTAFRVAEDRTFADVEDELFALPEDATVRLAHPLHLGQALAAWSEVFADYEILQPFPQLGRAVHRLTEEEAGSARLTRFEGRTVTTGKLLGLVRRGWERGEPQDAGVERWLSRRLGLGRYLVLAPSEGIAVGAIDAFPEQRVETVWLDTRPGDHWGRHEYSLRLGELDPVLASEVLADLTDLTEPAELTTG